MKRSILLGLFVTASIMASSSIAAGDFENLQIIANAQLPAPEIQAHLQASVQHTKIYQALASNRRFESSRTR